MSNPSCQHEGCHFDAAQKCHLCGRLFCLQHIAYMNPMGNDPTFGWICEECAAALVVKAKQRLRQWGRISIGAIAAIGLGFLWDANGFLLVGGFIGAAVAPGVWLINLTLRSRYQAFYKHNFK